MLTYILGITQRGNKEITHQGRFSGLQLWTRGITYRCILRDLKSDQKD